LSWPGWKAPPGDHPDISVSDSRLGHGSGEEAGGGGVRICFCGIGDGGFLCNGDPGGFLLVGEPGIRRMGEPGFLLVGEPGFAAGGNGFRTGEEGSS